LRISQINGCAHWIDMHSRDLIKGGVAIEKIVLVQAWREAKGTFDKRERAALAWAETAGIINTLRRRSISARNSSATAPSHKFAGFLGVAVRPDRALLLGMHHVSFPRPA
jgi:AhpD family alkylhydroperoxidase